MKSKAVPSFDTTDVCMPVPTGDKIIAAYGAPVPTPAEFAELVAAGRLVGTFQAREAAGYGPARPKPPPAS